MQFDTKVALVIRTDLEAWQKLNVAAFLASGIAAAFPESVGDPYEDGSGTHYHALIGQPILIYGADRPALSRALERALARDVKAAVYTEDMFKTTHDAANRAAFLADEEAYMRNYGLNEEQAAAIRSRQVLSLIAAGGNAYYLAKFAGIFGLDMQDIGAQQTGMTKDQFKARLVAARG